MSTPAGQAQPRPLPGGRKIAPRGRLASFLNLRALGDRVFWLLCLLSASFVILLAGLLVWFLVVQSWPAITTLGLSFFTTTDWNPVKDQYGALAFVYGTLTTSAIAMLIAVPLGVGSAAFLAEVAPGWLRRGGSFLIELLAAIPSVVYGFWGIFFLAPVVQRLFHLLGGPNTGGAGILSAGLILAIMVVPYIAALSYDACLAVPRTQREASLALGATHWQTIWKVVLPYARPGIIGASFLALGRALGETMAVTMLIGNRPEIELSPFALGDSIASVIANQLGNTSQELHRAALIELGLVLLLVTVVVNCLARLLLWRVGRQPTGRFVRPAPPPLPESAVPADQNGAPGEGRPASLKGRKSARYVNVLMLIVLGACVLVTLVPLFLILGYITYRGATALNWAFFTNLPIDDPSGLGHALLGSGILVGLATLFAVPVGILAAVYLAEYRRSPLTPPVRFIGELLGGVPSIILGIFGYALLVVPWGFSAWAGAFALGVMMIPVVMRASEEAMRMVPQTIRHASHALGATNVQTVLRVVIPAALPSIITGVFLAIARIAGETAPLLMTAYNSNFWPKSLNDRTPFLTYYIYTYSRSDDPTEQKEAWAAAFVLLALVIVLNVGIRVATGKRVLLASRAD
jgi:phosphate transport system permease protein